MKILIVSGAGFLAGSNLYMRFVNSLIKKVNFQKDSDYPEVILHNYPFSEIDESGFMGDKIKQELNNVLVFYKNVDILVLGCNTLHLLDMNLVNVKRMIHLPNLAINEVARSVLDSTFEKNVLALCSEYSVKENLFKSPFVKYPSDKLQKVCTHWIGENIHKKYVPTKEEMDVLKKEIVERKISHLIIGCTELNEIDWSCLNGLCKIVDSANLAINEVVNHIENERFRK